MNEAELIFSEILQLDRAHLYLNKDRRLNDYQAHCLASVLKRRMEAEPLQYILGSLQFMGLEFKVTPQVFIPRPETEILVEAALKIARSSQSGVRSVLDIGTGSGCIAISLAKYLPGAKITAVDISQEALKIAQENAVLNNTDVKFIHSDLFTDYRLPITDYDMIISNPPYVPTLEIETLQPEIQYEPRMALDGGRDGLDFYRRIAKQAPRYFKKNGWLLLEIGYNQINPVKNLLEESSAFKIIAIVKDYNNIDRVIAAQYKANG